MKKAILVICSILVLAQPVFADFKEHYDLGQQYLSNYQYSGAITEFKSALRINYLDNSARIGLVNSYLARGTNYANNEKNWAKAANDYRSALFYLIYYPNSTAVSNSSQAIVQVTSNLNRCLANMHFDTTPTNRFKVAKELRAEGDFAAAAYEFNQSLAERTNIKNSFQETGDIMKLLGNDQKAAEFYKKAVAIDPNDIDLRLSYAKILDKIGNEDDAVTEYNFILSKTSDNKDILYALERIYKNKLEENPSDATITSNLGAIMQKEGNYDEALKYYSKAEYLNPSDVNTRINVGTLYQQKGDYKTAITAYDSVLIMFPDNVNANLYKAQAYEAMGDTTKALDQYKKVTALEPDNLDAKNGMLAITQKTMTPQEFLTYVKANSGDNAGNSIYEYAVQLHKDNKLDDAISMYKEALTLLPNNPEVYANLAIAQSQKKEYTTALATLKTASAKFPDNKQIKDTLSSISSEANDIVLDSAADLYNKGEYENAIKKYLEAIPQTADTNLAIASAYQNLKNNDKAIEYYKKALALKPDTNTAYYIAALYADKNDLQNAQYYTTKALGLNKNNADAIALQKELKENISSTQLQDAINLFDKGSYEQSLALLNKVIVADPSNAYAFYYRGMIYDAQKKYSPAIVDYKKALSLNNSPDLSVIYYLIAVDYDTLKQYVNARSNYQLFISKYKTEDDYRKYAVSRIAELKNVK
ncbi:MAG: tetratricopeptide repeat protein [Clostridiaceae bacterium]|jgi:tetratricopeptide (TPR) repeat protein|nr:tetratricopeptide repeat protein [Clostridiaceae bacterium]